MLLLAAALLEQVNEDDEEHTHFRFPGEEDVDDPIDAAAGILVTSSPQDDWNEWFASADHLLDALLKRLDDFAETVLGVNLLAEQSCSDHFKPTMTDWVERGCTCLTADKIYLSRAVQRSALNRGQSEEERSLIAHDLAFEHRHGRRCCACQPCPRGLAERRARAAQRQWRDAGGAHALVRLRGMGWEIREGVSFQDAEASGYWAG